METGWLDAIRRIHTEIELGGDLSPCPFCCTPRVERSDYVRCCRCGINWLRGEPLDHDPRTHRQNLFRESLAQIPHTAKAEGNGHGR